MSTQPSPSGSPVMGASSAAAVPTVTTVRLSMELVKIKRIPPREFEQPATSVVTLTPQLLTYPRNEKDALLLSTRGVGGSGVRAALTLAAIAAATSSAGNSPVDGDGELADGACTDTVVTPALFESQQVFHDNDPYYNDRVEFCAEMPSEDDGSGGPIQGFPAGVTLPSSDRPSAASASANIPKPPATAASKSRRSIVGGSPSSPNGAARRRSSVAAHSPVAADAAVNGSVKTPRGDNNSVAAADAAKPIPSAGEGGEEMSPPADASATPAAVPSPPPAPVVALPPPPPKVPHFRIPIAVHDHNKPATPLLILKGLLDIPAVQTKGDVTLCVALTSALAPSAAAADGDAASAQQSPRPISAAPIKDEIDVIVPLVMVRYKVTIVSPPKEPVDHHADVLLEEEPRYTPDHQLVPDVTQYSWYHLLNDRQWLMGFSQALISQWSALPKIIYEDDAAKRRAAAAANKKAGSPFAPRSSSARGRGPAAVSYKSIADLMVNHWSVKRSHEAVTRMRIVADKYRRGEHMGFTAMEEYRLKLQWRERQVLRTTMAIDLLSDYSGNQVRVLLDRLWMNMVYGIPADDPTPPPLTYDMRNKLQNINFTSKHATILRACMLQLVVHGLTYNDALKIATDDFEQKNLTYVSRRGSLVGGEFSKSEAIMMAFGAPVQPTVAPPMNPVSEMEQLQRLMEDNKKNMKVHQRRSKSREKANRDGTAEEGGEQQQQQQHNATMGGTFNSTMMMGGTMGGTLAGTMGGTFNSTMALAGVTLRDNGALDLGEGPNGCARREIDFPAPMTYTPQKVFTTVVIDFVGRLLETLTDHEFIMILTAFIPAVTAASEKCLMVASGVPSTSKARGGSAKKKRGGSAKPKKKRAASSAAGGGGGGGAKDGASHNPSGPVQIEYLDSLGRRLPKKDGGTSETLITDEDGPVLSASGEEGGASPAADDAASPTTGDEDVSAGEDGVSEGEVDGNSPTSAVSGEPVGVTFA